MTSMSRMGRVVLGAAVAAAIAACGTHPAATPLAKRPGALSAAGEASMPAFVTATFARADHDRDGRLDGAESGLDAAQFRTLDRDSDGEISPDEWGTRTSLEEIRAKLAPFQPMVAAVRETLDADKDGLVTAAEALRAAGGLTGANRLEPLRALGVNAALRRADENVDGRLDKAEFDTFYLCLGLGETQAGGERGWFGRIVDGLLGGYLSVTSRIAADKAFHPGRKLVAMTPAKFGFAFEEVSFRTEDGLTLKAWFVPAAVPSEDTVIAIHGISDCRDTFVRQGQMAMIQPRYNQLVFDMRNHGQSDGTFTTFGYDEGKDVKAAMQWLAARGLHRVATYGISLGAATAIRGAVVCPEVMGVVDDCTYATVQYAMTGFISLTFIPCPALIASAAIERGNKERGIDMTSTEPITQVGRLGARPFLVIHGAADRNIAPENSRMLFQAAGTGGYRDFWLAPGGGHAASAVAQPAGYKQHLLSCFEQVFGR